MSEEATLESLLEAPPPQRCDDEKFSKAGIKRPFYSLHPPPLAKQARGQPYSRCKEASLELIAILLQQDVNGFFHFDPKTPSHQPHEVPTHFRCLERLIHTNRIVDLGEFRARVESLFEFYKNNNRFASIVLMEAARLGDIATRWFASLPAEMFSEPLIIAPTGPSFKITGESTENDKSVALGLLNPDNRGILSSSERVRSIGEEVGGLTFGTHLSQNGGYREDRRNRVIPYTYLNYGPFSTFGPSFDSGASNCSPEANQLLLSTSWLPARMLYSLEKKDKTETTTTTAEEKCPWDQVHLVEGLEQDAELADSLAECAAEWKSAEDEIVILESIIPPVVCGDHPDGDFGMYLANAITRNLPKEDPVADPEASDDEEGEDTEISASPIKENEELTNLDTTNENSSLLAQSATLLRDLHSAQYRRLGSDFSTTGDEASLRPSTRELRVAHKVADNLVNLVGRLSRGPGDLLPSRLPVIRAMSLDPLDLLGKSPQPPSGMDISLEVAD